jgi:choline dehydrogenase
MLVGLFRPASRGRLSLTVADRHAKLHIDPRYFAEPVDPEALCEGARQSMELASISALDPWRGGEWKALPADRGGSLDFVRRAAGSYRHPVGTCVMGTGPEAVVDPRLRARGITNLRIVDNSVMPTITTGHVMAPTMAIAKKAATLLMA